MCTVTYFPRGKNDFILTSNRDEAPSRVSASPDIRIARSRSVLYPQDPQSGGTWIATAENHRVACVLNGAFQRHTSSPPYARSRGLVLLDYFNYPNMEEFVRRSKLEGIEPFTMVLYEPLKLMEVRWDGYRRHDLELDISMPHLWGSVTLYDPPAIQLRRKWYDEWLQQHPQAEVDDILRFHQFGGTEDKINGLVIDRQGLVQTLSITSVVKRATQATMIHHNLLTKMQTVKKIGLSHAMVESN